VDFSENDLKPLLDILAKASGKDDAPISPEKLSERLNEIATAILGPRCGAGATDDEKEEVEAWRDFSRNDPSHVDLAVVFEAALTSDDPLAEVRTLSDAWASLKARLRTKWSSRRARAAGRPTSLDGLVWSDLDEGARADVLDRIAHLARYHRSFVNSGAKQKTSIDTLLVELADFFADVIGSRADPMTLPASPNSHFIQFATAAIALCPDSDAPSLKTISLRWRSLKAAQQY